MKTAILFQLNYISIFAAAAVYFLMGAVWYTPKVFALKTMHFNYIKPGGRDNPRKIMTIAFMSSLTSAFVLGYFINAINAASYAAVLTIGIISSLFLLGATVGLSYMFEDRKVKLYLSDAGYHLTGFMIMSLIIAFMR
ncbi:MAG: DUF1761 domain-containing protein [Syntrophothermus sp.]